MPVLSAFFRAAAMPAPPLPNPESEEHPTHWFHGTTREFYDHDEHDRDPEEHHDPGGTLRAPDTDEHEYGQNADKHWNTGLGVHFTSLHHVAQDSFAGGARGSGNREARVAHANLHIANPKHYDSEHDMDREAVQWAHQRGYHYLERRARTGKHADRWEDHLDLGGHYADVPHHDHLEYVDESTDRDTRRALDRIDRGDEDQTHDSYVKYLSLHPDRAAITHGFRQHLQGHGHDGITYGNEYEGPKGHTCAITFDEDQIHMKRWQWTHPEQQHLNTEKHFEPNDPHQPRLVDRTYTPEHGYHWIGPGKEKLAAQPVWKQPKPEIDMDEHRRRQAIDPEDYSHAEETRTKEKHWKHETRKALSRGDLSPQEAWNNGYKGTGHDEQHNGPARYHDTDRHNLSWEPMPETLWHVTTNKAGVAAAGHLKSRKELGQLGGHGLGGGDDDTVSYTDDPKVARDIHRAVHEYHSVLTGKKTVQHMLDEAKEGGYLHHVVGGQYGGGRDWKVGDPLPVGLREGLKGRRVLHGTLMDTTEEIKKKHPDAEPVEGTSHFDAPKGRIHHEHSVPMDDDEKMQWASSHYKYHAAMREHFGKDKVMDPGFIFNDVKGMASTHPSQFGIVRVHPKPGAMGYRVSALGEWRTADGSVAPVAGLESPHGPEQPEQHTAQRLTRVAKVNQDGHLENPYHDHSTWYHGTLGEFDDLSPAAVHAGHRPPGNGAGGPQMNKLLGLHFSPLHEVAHHFAGPHHGAAHGRIFHAHLAMKNPIHFENENSLLRHVWDTTMRSSYFHNDKHDANMQWSHNASREGINARLDASKGEHPGSLNSQSGLGSAESYLQFHPQQKDIAAAYINHLRYEGHDGITYGNDVEGPRRHHCAIAFEPSTIKVTSVDKMHPAKPPHPAWPEETKQKNLERRPGEVSHASIRAAHGESEEFLDEVERYHNGGKTRSEGAPYFGENTGRGDFKFHGGIKQAGAHGDLPEGLTYEYRHGGNGGTLIAHHPSMPMDYGYENFVGRIGWFHDNGEISAVDVHPDWQRRGVASELIRQARERHPDLHHSRTLSEEGKAWVKHVGALLPGYQSEHEWLPTGKVFAPSRGGLDPILFDEQRRMYPGVHQVIFERLNGVLEPLGLFDWQRWSRVYLAGSEASEWWGNRDFDTLIGVEYHEFRDAHPEHAALSDDEISDLMNGSFRKDYNDEDWVAPWDGEVWHLTAFVNPDSWDIRRIKPYAAYNMTTDTWAVEPVVVGKDWGPEKWPEGVWDMLESYLSLIKAIEKLPHPEQERQGADLYDWLHTDRRRAFSDHGTGWSDIGNVIWKALDLHPSEPLTKLVNWKHLEAADQGETEVSRPWYQGVSA